MQDESATVQEKNKSVEEGAKVAASSTVKDARKSDFHVCYCNTVIKRKYKRVIDRVVFMAEI